MHKHAFKMGFSFKLAEACITPDILVDLVAQHKLAKDKNKKDKGPRDEEKSPTQGFGTDGMTGAGKALGILVSGGVGASLVGSQALGRVGGGMLATGLANQMDTTDELRTRYLIKRYNDYIRERKAQQQNKLVSEALHG